MYSTLGEEEATQQNQDAKMNQIKKQQIKKQQRNEWFVIEANKAFARQVEKIGQQAKWERINGDDKSYEQWRKCCSIAFAPPSQNGYNTITAPVSYDKKNN